MGIVVYIIFFLFSLLLVKNYRLAVFTLSGWCLLFQEVKFPGTPFSLFDLLAIESLVFFFAKMKKNKRHDEKYPFVWATILVVCSLLVTNYFGIIKHWPYTIVFSIANYIFPILLWYALKTKEDIVTFTKVSVSFFFVLTLYGIVEVSLGYNPLLRWMISTNAFASNIIDSDRFRFGFKRIQSFMVMNGALGVSCSLFFLFLFYLKNETAFISKKTSIKHFALLVALLLLNILFTGTRSCYVTFVVASLYFVSINNLKSKRFYGICLLLLIIVIFNENLLASIWGSFTDTESVSGSNTDMRANQFDTALYFMNRNFMFGNGANYTYEYVAANFHQDILGAESIWLPLMIDQGIFGVVTYALFILYCLLYCVKARSKAGFFLTLSFIVAKTMTSVSGMNKAYFLIYLLVMLRAEAIEGKTQKTILYGKN